MSERPMSTECPAPETLGEFLDGALTGERLRAVNEHLATCEDCMEVMGTAHRFRSEPVPIASRRVMPPMRLAAIAAGMVVALVLGGLAWMRHSQRATGIGALIDAAPATYRRVEPRLTGFRWAELRRVRAGDALPPDPESLRLGGAAGEVLRRAQNDSSPDALHSAGVAELLLQQPELAIERLAAATQREPDRAAAWNDLAAAYYAHAVQAARPSELPLALAASDRALRIEPRSAEALFNRALILERMGLHGEAAEAWREFLAVEPSSRWADEAREHQNALARPHASLRADPEKARRWSEGMTLGEWADAVLAGDTATAAKKLAAARSAGASLLAANGDALLADAVAAIDRSGTRLAAAHAAYFHGRLRYRDHDLARAERDLLDAAGAFEREKSPMEAVSRLFAASVAFDDNRIDDAAHAIEAFLPSIPSQHASLIAETRALRGRCAMYEARWDEAIDDFDAAAAIFRRLGENGNLALAEAALGDCWSGAGRGDEAWTHRVEAFRLLDAAERRIAAIAAATRAELRDDREDSAAALLRVEVDEARRGGKPLLIADAYERSALLHSSAGDLRLARSYLAREPDSGLRRHVESECAVAAGILERQRDPRRSVALLNDAIAFQRASGERLSIANLLLERARSHRASGDEAAARADLAAGMDEIERERGDYDTAASLVEESVDLAMKRGDVATAFANAEQAHGRAVVSAPASPKEIAQALAQPSGAPAPSPALVEYVLLPNAITAITITTRETRAIKIPIDRTTLTALIRRQRDTIERREDERSAAAELHKRLIAPLALDAASSLIIVPDRQLQSIAWAALYDGTRNEYLIEQHQITVAPNAAVWMRNAAAARSRRGERLLLISDGGGGSLDVLDHVRVERSELESLYPDRLELDAGAATPAAFLARANECDVIHFAGHTRAGALLMRGPLQAADVAHASLTRPRLAVLAACGTIDAGAGFLRAGVPRVIGTLWPIDDREAARLFGELHRRLRSGDEPAAALRDAQLMMIRAGQPPAAWAAAELIGG